MNLLSRTFLSRNLLSRNTLSTKLFTFPVRQWFACFCMLVLLSACGGGNSGGNDKPSNTVDTTPPVIKLNGEAAITLTQGDSYTDLSAIATDNKDGDITVVVDGNVDTSVAGSYTITYTATDAAKNTSKLTRTVTVVIAADTTAPVITLNGESSVTVVVGRGYTDAGATAVDDRDGVVTVVASSIPDATATGSYTITYTATDAANNAATATRTVVVISPRPFITTWKTDNRGFTGGSQIKI